MKKIITLIIILTLLIFSIVIALQPVSACGKKKKPEKVIPTNQIIKEYGTVNLSGGIDNGHFNDIWDLTKGELKIEFVYNATGLVDDGFDPNTLKGTMAISQLGFRDTSVNDSNPYGKGIWFNPLYDTAKDTFSPNEMIDTNWDKKPDTEAYKTFDPDDRLILQKGGPNWDEQDYDLPGGKINPQSSYGVWFDRDGINATQEKWWGFENGTTHNTSGIYNINIKLKAINDTFGHAYLKINGINQGFWDNGWNNTQPPIYPAGMSFKGDLKNLQLFYSLFGVGATHNVVFKDIKITQTIDFELKIDIMVNVTGKCVKKQISKVLPKNVDIDLDIDLDAMSKCSRDIEIDLGIEIDINDKVAVNVNINIDILAANSKNDVDVGMQISVVDATDVNIDSIIEVRDVGDDAKVKSKVKVKDSQDVNINLNPVLHDIGDDAKVRARTKVKNSNNVSINSNATLYDIGDDAKVIMKTIVINCDDVIVNLNTIVHDVTDDAKIWLKIYTRGCVNPDANTNVKTWNIGDRTKIRKCVLIK